MTALVTALVDTYNHEKYIEQALVSVLEQGLSPAELEIVVVDDGSTDRTPEIIQKFVPRVRHLRKSNGGQASAFNAGFREMQGEIVATLDGDDWWAKGKLEAVIQALEQCNEVAAVGHGYYEFHEETQETILRVPPGGRTILNIETPEAIHTALVTWPYLLMGALTLRRKAMEWIMPISEEMVFMADIALATAARVQRALVLDQPLFYYRHHGGNLSSIGAESGARLRRRCEMEELAGRCVYRMLVERGVSEATASALLDDLWLGAKRLRLSRFGGSRFETFATEMEALRVAYKSPSARYRMFKYVAVAAATLLFPPRTFYSLRDWYARRGLGRYRELAFPAEIAPSRLSRGHAQPKASHPTHPNNNI
jgi:glycosyltransferase involved in cell wall biosynthesis